MADRGFLGLSTLPLRVCIYYLQTLSCKRSQKGDLASSALPESQGLERRLKCVSPQHSKPHCLLTEPWNRQTPGRFARVEGWEMPTTQQEREHGKSYLQLKRRKETQLTKLEIGVIRADMITGTEHPFHHQSNAHSIKETKMLWDPIVLEENRAV